MFKELLLAIILGALLGFGITGGLLTQKKSHPPATPSPTPTSKEENADQMNRPTTALDAGDLTSTTASLTVESPQNEALVTSSSLTIRGSTAPNSRIVVLTASKNYTATSDDDGNFTQDIELDSGSNIISINAFDTLDNQSTVQLLITYTTAKI